MRSREELQRLLNEANSVKDRLRLPPNTKHNLIKE